MAQLSSRERNKLAPQAYWLDAQPPPSERIRATVLPAQAPRSLTALLPVDSPLTLNDSNAYVDACVAGLGIGRLPTYMFSQYPSCGTLELVLCDWKSDDIPFHVVYPSNRHLSSKVRVFVDWVAEILEHHTGMQMCAHAKAEREKLLLQQRHMPEPRVMPMPA